MSEENRKKEETMEEPTREMEKETGAETDLPETEPAAEQEEAKKAAEAKEAEAAEETAEDGKERKFFKKKKDKKDEKIEELTDRLTRQMAEFDNFRKRTEKEKANMYAIGAKDIIEKILPVVDSFERGLATVENPEEDPFADGMNKVYKQFTTALDELGVTVIEAVGKEFDPNLHNAVMHVEDEEAGENIVVDREPHRRPKWATRCSSRTFRWVRWYTTSNSTPARAPRWRAVPVPTHSFWLVKVNSLLLSFLRVKPVWCS